MNLHLESLSENRSETLIVSEEHLESFRISILRYRRILYFVAHRVLGNHGDAEAAVENCLLSVSRNVPSFECKGSFRGWLVKSLSMKLWPYSTTIESNRSCTQNLSRSPLIFICSPAGRIAPLLVSIIEPTNAALVEYRDNMLSFNQKTIGSPDL